MLESKLSQGRTAAAEGRAEGNGKYLRSYIHENNYNTNPTMFVTTENELLLFLVVSFGLFSFLLQLLRMNCSKLNKKSNNFLLNSVK